MRYPFTTRAAAAQFIHEFQAYRRQAQIDTATMLMIERDITPQGRTYEVAIPDHLAEAAADFTATRPDYPTPLWPCTCAECGTGREAAYMVAAALNTPIVSCC